MSKLHLIPVMEDVTTIDVPQTHLEYGDENWEQMRKFIGEEFMEHVSVWFDGKPAHMFVDENGLAKALHMNPKGTRVYWNNTFRRETNMPELQYNDLTKTPFPPPPLKIINKWRLEGFLIVGPAALWEGEME